MAPDRCAGVGPADTHFNPPYNPWDQRMCAVPDGDLFTALRGGKAAIATGGTRTFTEDGINLESGEHLPADIIVVDSFWPRGRTPPGCSWTPPQPSGPSAVPVKPGARS